MTPENLPVFHRKGLALILPKKRALAPRTSLHRHSNPVSNHPTSAAGIFRRRKVDVSVLTQGSDTTPAACRRNCFVWEGENFKQSESKRTPPIAIVLLNASDWLICSLVLREGQ